MIKPKAPKDMSAEEFENYIEENRLVIDNHINNKLCNRGVVDIIDGIFEFMRYSLKQPAPNPFTPDQLAWMRVMQAAKYSEAYRGTDGYCYLKGDLIPAMGVRATMFIPREFYFIYDVLPLGDTESLFFADYTGTSDETVIS